MISPECFKFYPLFAGQNDYMLKELAMLTEERSVEADTWLFRQGEVAEWLYLVQDGAMALAMVLHRNGSGEHVEKMGSIGRGELLGWSALIKPHVYTLDARATRKTKLLQIEAIPLRELLEDNPQFGYFLIKNIAEVISERLRYKCIQLLSMKV